MEFFLFVALLLAPLFVGFILGWACCQINTAARQPHEIEIKPTARPNPTTGAISWENRGNGRPADFVQVDDN